MHAPARTPTQTQLSQPNPTTSLLTTFQRLDGVAKEAITYLLKHCPLNTVKVLAALYKRTWFTIIPALWRFKQNVSSQDEQTLHDELKIVVLRINFVSTGLVVDVLKGMDVKKRKGPPETAQQAKLREDCEHARGTSCYGLRDVADSSAPALRTPRLR